MTELIYYQDQYKTEIEAKIIKVEGKQFGKIIRIPPQGKGTYRKKNKTGVLTIGITNKRLKEKVFEMINGI